VNNAKHRCVTANSQGKCEYRGSGESRPLHERFSETDVLQQSVHKRIKEMLLVRAGVKKSLMDAVQRQDAKGRRAFN
jgi:hypothetical protein